MAVTVYATTAISLLSGRCRYGRPPPSGAPRHRGPYNYRAAKTPQVDQVIQTVVDIARERGRTPTQVAMAWCLRQPGITAVITGADTADRVRENCGAVGWQLTEEETRRLDVVSEGQRLVVRNDCPRGYEGTAPRDQKGNGTPVHPG